ncbi:ataxin-2 isoform X3 [Trichomycterus rosablanca]|uniref:ataxin-2 isoform X3 n=1 Tax=Trichomycterus rosablanca TaxID=2290929 RepID=UPI002F35A2DE
MSMKQAGGNRKAGGSSGGAATASGAGGCGGAAAAGRHSLSRGHNVKGSSTAQVVFSGVYANMRMVHVLTSVVGTNCELKVKNGVIYEGVFKTYGPECDLVLDAAHRKSPERNAGPRREDIVESIIFKTSDVVMVHFKDVDLNYAKKVSSEQDNLTDNSLISRLNGEHKEKDLEPWDAGDQHGSLESLDTDLSNGWDPDDMFKYNEETYGVKSTYDSSLSTYTVPLERDNSEEFLKREARAAQLADEIEASASYKARVALENDERSEEEKYSSVARDMHALNRENKYIPPGQRNRETGMSWGSGRQNSSRVVQCSPGPPTVRAAPHDYNSISGVEQRIVNGGPPRMSPKTQRAPRAHRVSSSRGTGPPGVEFLSQGSSGEALTSSSSRSSSSGGTWSSVVSGGHRPHSPRQNNIGGVSPGPISLSSPQAGAVPVDSVVTAASLTTASSASNLAATPSAEAKDPRIPEMRQNSPLANKENVKPMESSTSSRPVSKGASSMPPDHRKQIDNLKKFSVDFRLQSTSNPDPVFETMSFRDSKDKLKEENNLPESRGPKVCSELSSSEELPAAIDATPVGSKPGTPSPCSLALSSEQKRVPDMTSQGVQTSSPTATSAVKTDREDKEEKKDHVPESVRKSTLNPNAKEFNPRAFCTQPKPATTPTLPRPQGQPSPSIVVQQPPAVYGQPMCFPQMYPLTGVQKSIIWKPPAVYQVQVPHMTVSQSKPYRPVPNIPQQRSDQHHPAGTTPMMHPATAAGPPIVAPNPAYSTQYFTCNPQQFSSQPLVQQLPHYQSQAQHVFSQVMQGSARMISPPSHGQPNLVSSSTTQYGEQTHTMYVSATIPQQYPHHSATLHPLAPQPPQPSATPTAQAQHGAQHVGNSHTAASPVQHPPHQASLHLTNAAPPQQQMYSTLTPTPPSMTPGPAPQSPQAVYIHPPQIQHSYNPNHMAHMQQAHMQSGMVPSHHGTHPPMMLMATQAPAQNTLNPIPVSSNTHFSYMAHPHVQPHHQQQL